MTVTPTLTFSIDRTSLSLGALVLSAASGVSTLGIVSYREPAEESDNFYAGGSSYAPRVLLATQLAPTFHSLLLVPQVTTQSAEDTAIAAFKAAIRQFSFTVTTTRNGSARTWTCQPGSMAPANDRTRIDLAYLKPLWAVTIPCDPTFS